MKAQFTYSKKKLKNHFSESIWSRDSHAAPLYLRLWRAGCRLLYLIGYGFVTDQCIIRAAALTFTTILSIVPFLAVAFSISKGFGLQNSHQIRGWILQLTTGRPEVADKIIEYIDRTNVQALGWVGVATLLFTVLSLIGTIEKAFNTIWHVNKGRSAWRKVTDFFPVIVFGPMVLFIASSFNVSLQQQDVVVVLLSMETIGWLENFVLKFTPYFLIIGTFGMMYSFIPNIHVRISSAALGGIVAGILWQLAQWGYIHWQIGAAKYNAIYGSFAQLPVLLMWIYISWTVVLLGAEVSYAWQHIDSFAKQRYFGRATPIERQKIAVLMMLMVEKNFRDGKASLSVQEISDGLMAPASLISDLFLLLKQAGLIVQTSEKEREAYVPARLLDDVRILEIIRIINMEGDSTVLTDFSDKFGFIDDLFLKLGETTKQSEGNMTLRTCAEDYSSILLKISPTIENKPS